MTNSADPDQLASSEANWSGSTLFAKIGHVVFSKRRVKMWVFQGVHSQGKSHGKKYFFKGQGIVREYWNLSGNFGILAKVREKSGNFEKKKNKSVNDKNSKNKD